MRKTIAVLLAIMLTLVLMCSALAYDEEITFQGIPWESSDEEAVRLLIENGVISSDSDANSKPLQKGGSYLYLWDKDIPALGANVTQDGTDYTDVISHRYFKSSEKRIGGYEINKLNMTYATNGTDGGKLICVYFTPKAEVAMDAYNDLCEKLTSVYGAGVPYVGSAGGGHYYISYWMGGNNTAIYIAYYDNDNTVHVYYGTCNSFELLNEALKDIPVPQNDVENTTDGL